MRFLVAAQHDNKNALYHSLKIQGFIAMKRVHIVTHGCQMNVYDSTSMGNVLSAEMGYTLTPDPECADVLILNTCSIREGAEKKVLSELGRWAHLKKVRPDIRIGVGGCVASQEGEALLRKASFIDLIFGPQTLHRLPDLLSEREKTGKAVVDIAFPEIEKFDRLPEAKATGVTAFVSIMEGCSKYCSYCVVPYTRGTEISRPFEDVLLEVATLVDQGVKEVTLLGQNVNDYQGRNASGERVDLAELISYLNALENLERIRFTTSHPLAFSDRLIDAYASFPKLANHLHLPVQSGSNRILGMMKRGYTIDMFYEKMARLRKYRPDISITSDFIIGFPGETETDFMDTMKLVEDIHFDLSFSFIYSPRPGTPAALLADIIPMEEKRERLQRLQTLLTEQATSIGNKMIGQTHSVLAENPTRRDANNIFGRASNNRVIHFEAPASVVGTCVDVQVTAANSHTLKGEYKA